MSTSKEFARSNPEPLDIPYPFSPPSKDPSEPLPSSSAYATGGGFDREFLEKATGLTDEGQLREHVETIQREAYAVYPYRCIKRWTFALTKAAHHPVYPEVLAILKNDPQALFLDLGCFCGTDVRKLAIDGWPQEQIIGSDLRDNWFELGYKLFSDKSTCKITFLPGDIFSKDFLSPTTEPTSIPPSLPSLTSLTPLRHHLRAISTFAFFHLFSEEDQVDLAQRLKSLLSEKKGSVIFGIHQGSKEGKLKIEKSEDHRELFAYDPKTWVDLWETQIYPASRLVAGQSPEGPRVKAWARIWEADPRAPKSREGRTTTMFWAVTVV